MVSDERPSARYRSVFSETARLRAELAAHQAAHTAEDAGVSGEAIRAKALLAEVEDLRRQLDQAQAAIAREEETARGIKAHLVSEQARLRAKLAEARAARPAPIRPEVVAVVEAAQQIERHADNPMEAEIEDLIRLTGYLPEDWRAGAAARTDVPELATSWLAQALDDPRAGGTITESVAATVWAMVRRYDATGIGWAGERSAAVPADNETTVQVPRVHLRSWAEFLRALVQQGAVRTLNAKEATEANAQRIEEWASRATSAPAAAPSVDSLRTRIMAALQTADWVDDDQLVAIAEEVYRKALAAAGPAVLDEAGIERAARTLYGYDFPSASWPPVAARDQDTAHGRARRAVRAYLGDADTDDSQEG